MSEPASAPSATKPSSSVKLVLLGEAAVGKVKPSSLDPPNLNADHLLLLSQSSLVLRFVKDDFQENKEPTIGGTHPPPPFSTSFLHH